MIKINAIETIFIIQGYESKMDNGQINDSCVIEVYADSEKHAIDKAKKYIKKSYYRVAQVIEKHVQNS